MKDILAQTLNELDGYLISITRNTETASYELTVGVRSDWEYKETEDVEFEIQHETEHGTILLISGKHEDVIIDDLVNYVRKVIITNERLAQKKKEFEDSLKQAKEMLKKKVASFQSKLDDFTDKAFDNDADIDIDEFIEITDSESKDEPIVEEEQKEIEETE